MSDKIYGDIRLKPIEPDDVTDEQKPLFDELRDGVDSYLHGFTTQTTSGALIGPFNTMLHFPAYGKPVWDLFMALNKNTILPKNVREVVILSTGAVYGSLFELYSHEATSRGIGFDEAKLATLAAGERPSDLTREEQVAYDLAAVLNRRHQPANSTYEAATAAFGEQGTAEIVYLVLCYASISTLLNAFDVNLPRTELSYGTE